MGVAGRSEARSAPLYDLPPDDCWALLARAALGRLAVAAGGTVDVFPVNYAVDGHRLLFRTNEGTRLAALVVDHEVAFEVDGTDEQNAWSVVVKGVAHPLDAVDERLVGERPAIVSWLPAPRTRTVAIEPSAVTGRGFVRGAEPDADWY
jgi:hypothetical protein